ncbi:hypothetical protein JAAARDRAFT_30090 [Jaapia argillacea MUCL 33604]|uniref:Uncharacterized protein n=1 Tax=Jaapia argillacea MUCL 33604 TaxID=933084 RepID=A0A067Q5C9_9AGAM|nr:hypothetical protein JAAARDRAFT_30090 [Jaapia argillacea MUCL 33604]
MAWGKTPGRPAHEYLIVGLDGAALRLERDAGSWASLVGPNYRDKCKDTVTISQSPDTLVKKGDQVLATLRFPPSVVRLSYLAALLELIMGTAKFYNVYTFNCWWFAGCIWSNLATCAEKQFLYFRVEMEDIVAGGSHGLDPTQFAQRLHEGHLSGLKRLYGEPVASAKKELEMVSVLIESAFHHVVSSKKEVYSLRAEMEASDFAWKLFWTSLHPSLADTVTNASDMSVKYRVERAWRSEDKLELSYAIDLSQATSQARGSVMVVADRPEKTYGLGSREPHRFQGTFTLTSKEERPFSGAGAATMADAFRKALRKPDSVAPLAESPIWRSDDGEARPFSGADAAIMAEAFRKALRKPDYVASLPESPTPSSDDEEEPPFSGADAAIAEAFRKVLRKSDFDATEVESPKSPSGGQTLSAGAAFLPDVIGRSVRVESLSSPGSPSSPFHSRKWSVSSDDLDEQTRHDFECSGLPS